MQTDTKKRIIEFIQQNTQVTAKELEDHLGISRQALFKHLPKMMEEKQLTKIGRPPKVFYSLFKQFNPSVSGGVSLDPEIEDLIEAEFNYVTPTGKSLAGVEAFSYFCERQKIDLVKAAQDYFKLWKKYHDYQTDGFIDGSKKMQATFKEVFLDEILYLDFYSIERFGKTKLGQMLLYAKQSQNKAQIKEVAEMLKPRIEQLIKLKKIDAIGYIPPSVKREVQLMKELERWLKLSVPAIKLLKVKTPIIVPQKTLSKLEDRVENASQTIIVEEKQIFKNILLIDDAVGSGATLNETARSIKNKKICKGKIIGLAIVGSFKGFDVINEV